MSRLARQTAKLFRIEREQATRFRLERDPYKLERRREDRGPANGSVAASYSNGVDRFGITHLQMVDRSPSGLGVRTRTKIDPGMIVTICPEGSTVPWMGARAARCERQPDGGYLVGLVMNDLAAA